MFQNGGKASINVRFPMEQSVPISSNTFWGTPFLEKGSPKITKGGPFDSHWPISRINLGNQSSHPKVIATETRVILPEILSGVIHRVI